MTLDTGTYERARKAGAPARYALALARSVAQRNDDDELPDYGHPVTIERDGWRLRLSVTYDDGMTLADLGYGRFLAGVEDWRTGHEARPEPDAIRNPYRDSRNVSGGLAWYVPGDMGSMAERAAEYRKHGTARGPAWEAARESVEAELCTVTEDYGPSAHVLTVEAMRNGIVLGTASLGGCEVGWSDVTRTDGREYLAESYDDLIAEAIADATATLASLCAPEGC